MQVLLWSSWLSCSLHGLSFGLLRQSWFVSWVIAVYCPAIVGFPHCAWCYGVEVSTCWSSQNVTCDIWRVDDVFEAVCWLPVLSAFKHVGHLMKQIFFLAFIILFLWIQRLLGIVHSHECWQGILWAVLLANCKLKKAGLNLSVCATAHTGITLSSLVPGPTITRPKSSGCLL